ncbi:MAG: lysylphosphatidylglycerol synthase transmembrane domain-containing protein [Candidatus Gracilibacteria bacterium]|jgi:uncharacterized protein (TIRG00374 family)|nr:lysylphosphatidylglycerol synthase transmembrane domain-containing protein [Candidatus Gracilibacteria bacterium]
MKDNFKKYFSIILTIFFLVFLIIYIFTNIDSFKHSLDIRPIYIIPISLLILISLYINGIALNLYTKPFNLYIKEHFQMSLSTSFLNLITPFRGGMGFRALYLKKKYNFSYSKFASSLLGNYVIIFIIISFLGILASLYFLIKEKIFVSNFFAFFLIIFLITLFSIFTNFRFKKEFRILKTFNNVMDGFDTLKKDKKTLILICFFTLLNIFILTLINYLVFIGLGEKISYFESSFLSLINTLSTFINITPGSLGITEAFYFMSAKSLSISTETSVLASLIIRAINALILITTGTWSYINITRNIKQKNT